MDNTKYSGPERKLKIDHRLKELKFYEHNKNTFNQCVSSNCTVEIAQKIAAIAISYYKVPETPNMLHRKPGILSEQDIQLAISSKAIKIIVPRLYHRNINNYFDESIYNDDGELIPSAVKASSIDLFLSPECFVLKKNNDKQIDLVMGDESELSAAFKKRNFPANIDIHKLDNLEKICDLVDESRNGLFKTLFERKEVNLKDGLVLESQEITLCSSLENIEIASDIVAFITSKYSYSQMGLSVSLCQNILQPSHKGQVMLQLKNNLPNPIVIYANSTMYFL